MFETDRTPKRVGIVGLGLIGGSFAKAYADAGIEVFAADIDERAMNAAEQKIGRAVCRIPRAVQRKLLSMKQQEQ